jgi:hypothetical protein
MAGKSTGEASRALRRPRNDNRFTARQNEVEGLQRIARQNFRRDGEDGVHNPRPLTASPYTGYRSSLEIMVSPIESSGGSGCALNRVRFVAEKPLQMHVIRPARARSLHIVENQVVRMALTEIESAREVFGL